MASLSSALLNDKVYLPINIGIFNLQKIQVPSDLNSHKGKIDFKPVCDSNSVLTS